MNFQLTKEQEMFKREMRRFCENEIAPRAAEWDERQEFPWENIEKLKKMELWGLTIPEAYGGSEADMTTYVTAVIEMARCCANTAVTFFLHSGVPTKCVGKFGTEEQRKKYLPPAAAGETLFAFGQTEPESGSDAASLKTKAVLDGDHYVINGNKCFITSGEVASIYIVWARTDPGAAKPHQGLSCFIVEKGSPGFSFGKKENKLGMRGSPTVELIFEDCMVPKENIVLQHPDAFRTMMNVFNEERLGNSSACIGIAEAAYEYAIKYIQQRTVFGKKVSEYQGIQWMVADMAIQIEMAKLLLYKAAGMVDQGLPIIKESCMTKIVANEMSQKVSNMAMQLLGGYGYMRDFPVERNFRDCRGFAFGGGTPQVLRTVLAAQLIKKHLV